MFRIWIFLNIKDFILGLFFKNKTKGIKNYLTKKICEQTKKKYLVLTSQCRVGFLFILKYLKRESKKNEIIFCAYNLPEMINIAVKLKFKIIFCDINYKSGSMEIADLKNKISKKTSAIVLTNMFNDFKNSLIIKKLASKNKINLIEDNAIYFDNFTKKKKKKIFSGSVGKYTIYSFNIMKNISSFYGGAVATSDKKFIKFYEEEYSKLDNFPKSSMMKQIIIYVILKVMSLRILYKTIFLHLIKFAHFKNIKTILKLFYPSLRLIRKNLPNYYFTKMSKLSMIVTSFQLKDLITRRKLFYSRQKKNDYYFKKISKIKHKDLSLINVIDKNYQNFLDFPILVRNKTLLNKFLLNKGIEVRFKHYYNCEKLFNKNEKCINAEKYEKELICLPVHPKITFSYIDYIVKNIEQYYFKIKKNRETI